MKTLLAMLEKRFTQNMPRHANMKWSDVLTRIQKSDKKLRELNEMERTGGEPDVVVMNGEIAFVDCAAESPSGRRSLCFDDAAFHARKENKPEGSACALAAAMGIELLDEAHYRQLQTLGDFDLKTSSWIATPASVRALGGALFCDRRYGNVFTYHNGAQSFYAARGFRGMLRV